MEHVEPVQNAASDKGHSQDNPATDNNIEKPENPPPRLDFGKSVGHRPTSDNKPDKSRDEDNHGRENLLKWRRDFGFSEIFVVATAIFAGTIAHRQNTLVDQQNALMVKANEIAGMATKAAESSAIAAKQSIAMAKAGEETANKTAKAIADTAASNEATAQATKDIAQENIKMSAATEKVAQASQLALATSTEANLHAAKAAKAAEDAVNMAKKSMALSANTTIHQLRAYMSIIGTELRYDPAGRRMVATITLENTGQTPAHNVGLSWNVVCLSRPSDVDAALGLVEEVTPRSIGPKAKFVYKKAWAVRGNGPPALNQQMDMWIYGAVKFKDGFTDDSHYTSFKFTQGNKIGKTDQWEMIFANDGNESDRSGDKLLRELSEPGNDRPFFIRPRGR